MTDHEDAISVFSKKFTGGPLGLGDPNDRTLRHVEDSIFITELVKNRAHHEKCQDKIKKWGLCMEENASGWKGLFTFYTCKKQVDEMNDCLKHYYSDPEFRKECTELYLDKRSKYRATGIMEKDPYYKKRYYESDRKKEFMEEYRRRKEEEKQRKTEETKA